MELQALDVMEEVLDDPMWDDEQKEMIENSVNGGHLQCYLFQCLHCGKHLVWMDCDQSQVIPINRRLNFKYDGCYMAKN